MRQFKYLCLLGVVVFGVLLQGCTKPVTGSAPIVTIRSDGFSFKAEAKDTTIAVVITDADLVSAGAYTDNTFGAKAGWLSVSYVPASSVIKVSASKNSTQQERTAYIRIVARNSRGEKTASIRVSQEGASSSPSTGGDSTDEVAFAKSFVTISADEGASATVLFTKDNFYYYYIWTLDEDGENEISWLTADLNSSETGVTVVAQANTDTEPRTAVVVLATYASEDAVDYSSMAYFYVEQEACSIPAFSVSASSLSVGALATEASFSVDAHESVSWTAVSSNSEFTLSPASGTGSAGISVKFGKNTSSSAERKTTITVSTTNSKVETKSWTITITQAPSNDGDIDPGTPGYDDKL